jgi:biopolymer transport protein TolR
VFVHRKRPIAEINLVPYIDVMLVLVVILMVTTPLLTQGVDVSLPQESSQAINPDQPNPIIVTVNRQGELFLNNAQPNKPLATQQLLAQVAAELLVNPDSPRQVLVRGDQYVAYGNVVRVMALLQQTGVKQIGLLTQSPQTVAEK